jgi:hypothetical protein
MTPAMAKRLPTCGVRQDDTTIERPSANLPHFSNPCIRRKDHPRHFLYGCDLLQ